MELKHIRDRDPWILGEEVPDIDFHFTQIWLSSFVNDIYKTIGINYKKILSVYNGYNQKFFYGTKDSENVAHRILELLKADASFGEEINSKIRLTADRLKSMSAEIDSEKLRAFSNEELISFHRQLDDIHTEFYVWGWLPNAVDMFTNDLTNYVKSEVEKKVGTDKVNTVLMTLTAAQEKSIVQQEHESLLNLVQLKQANSSLFEKELSKHRNKYFFVKHLWIGSEGYDAQYYIDEIDKIISEGKSGKDLLIESEALFQKGIVDRKALLAELQFNPQFERLLNVYAEFAVTKSYRRDAQLYWAYQMDAFFDELSHRLGITFKESRFLLPVEIYDGLDKGLSDIQKSELKERSRYCVYYAEEGIDKIYVGDEAKKLEQTTIVQIDTNITEFKGQTACLGHVTGLVKIVNSPADMDKMHKGDVLVSIATNPDIVLAMKKAAAIITEQGGITSHAAIVSRELGIPCVIGTKIATKVLKDGDMVEVDANTGTVKIIS